MRHLRSSSVDFEHEARDDTVQPQRAIEKKNGQSIARQKDSKCFFVEERNKTYLPLDYLVPVISIITLPVSRA